MPATTKKLSQKQLIASLIVEDAEASGGTVYVVKTPRADAKHNTKNPEQCIGYCCQKGSGLSMYGLSFTDGVAITTDLELVKKITSEFPNYTYEELAA